MKTAKIIVPMNFYKSNLKNDLRELDELFKISDLDIEGIIESSPLRGEFKMENIPYGWYLTGYDGEVQITILSTAMQSGTNSIMVIFSEIDSLNRALSCEVAWDNEETAINDMINRLYFDSDMELIYE